MTDTTGTTGTTGTIGTTGTTVAVDDWADGLRVTHLDETHLMRFGGILRSSVQPEHQRFLVDNQHGYLDYLRLILRFPESFPHHRLRVIAAPGDRPAAFADFRVHPSCVGFLSSLVVFPQFRRMGLSRRLLTAFAREFPEVTTLGLDVFADNEAAIGLYSSTGFRPVATDHWLVRDIEPGPHRLAVSDLPQVLSMHETYGFCSFVATGAEAHGRVGLLGDEVINCFEETPFTDLDFLAAAARTFDGRRIAFHATPHRGLADEPGIRLVNTSVRMELTDLSALRGGRTHALPR